MISLKKDVCFYWLLFVLLIRLDNQLYLKEMLKSCCPWIVYTSWETVFQYQNFTTFPGSCLTMVSNHPFLHFKSVRNKFKKNENRFKRFQLYLVSFRFRNQDTTVAMVPWKHLLTDYVVFTELWDQVSFYPVSFVNR